MKSAKEIAELHSGKKCVVRITVNVIVSLSLITSRIFNNTSRFFLLNVQHSRK